MDVTTFRVLNRGLPRTPLKADRNFITRKSITVVTIQGASPRVMASLIVPSGITLSMINLKKGKVVGSARFSPIFW